MTSAQFSGNFAQDTALLDSVLRVSESFDMVGRDIMLGSLKAKLYFVDGFCKDELMERIMAFLMTLKDSQTATQLTARDFSNTFVPYVETDVVGNVDGVVKAVLSGAVAMVVDKRRDVVIVDARTYPVRAVDEPENDKVLRGPHDGFVETIVFNTALIRRRVRDPNLIMHICSVGKKSKTDVVLCYLDDRVDKEILATVKKKIEKIDINSLAMGQQSLIECLVRKQWYNPFPKVRYTERPDAAAASALEGSIIILTDNSPAAMIIPSGIFDFLQDTNDYYMSPFVGSYIRIIRSLVFAITLLLTPVWLLLMQNPELIPQQLQFIKVEQETTVPFVIQLLIIELIIDALKMASLNTPNALGNSFSVVGALVLGEFAVSSGWFVSEVVLYMAFVAITNFVQPSFELGYAFKIMRIILIVLIALFNLWGFAAGITLTVLLIATTKTVSGKSYLYPLIPFKPKALLNLILRRPISVKNS